MFSKSISHPTNSLPDYTALESDADSESDKDISSCDNSIQSDLDADSASEKDTLSLESDSTAAMSVDPHLMYKDEKLPFPHLPRSWYIKEQ